MNNYLIILGLTAPCTQKQIRDAFIKLAHIHHPDKGGSAEKFKEINKAYQELKKYGDIPAGRSEPVFGGQMPNYWGRSWSEAGGGFGSVNEMEEAFKAYAKARSDDFERQRAAFNRVRGYKVEIINGQVKITYF